MYKKTIHLLGVLLLVSWLSPTAFALAMNWSVDRFLTEVLDELSEKYQVFFTYDAQLLKEIKVDYQYDKEANITIIIAALLHNTGLRYEQLSEKYFVLYKDNDSGRKIMKKMKRKLNDLEKLERMGNFALQSQNSSKSDQRLTQINQALENLPFQQIKGVIEDENGEALIGASIRVKDSNIGVATNINGQFELKIPKHFKTLLISYIGFQDQEITIN